MTKKLKRILICLLLFVCILADLLPINVYAASSFINGGFENVTSTQSNWSSNIRPVGWSGPNRVNTPANATIVALLDNTVKKSGDYSLKLGSSTDDVRIMVSQTVTGLDANKYYRLSGYIKVENYVPAVLGSAGPIIQALVAGTTNYYATTKIESSTSDWTYVENIFRPGSSEVRIDCNFVTGRGFAWFDDITIEEYVPVQSVSVSPHEYTLEVGSQVTLNEQVYPLGIEYDNVVWSSSDPDIATVDSHGTVTPIGRKGGRVVVSASITENLCVPSTNGKKLSPITIEGICIINVVGNINAPAVSSIILDKKTAEMKVDGNALQLTADILPKEAIVNDLQWTSSNNSVASVHNGFVVAKSVGTAVITASFGNVSDSCTITVKKPDDLPKIPVRTYIPDSNFDLVVASSGYPRLLFDFSDINEIRQKITNPMLEKSYKTMANSAYSYLNNPSNVHNRQKSGGRVLNKVICDLAITGYINKDMRYINKAIDYMMGSANAYSAIDYKNMNGDIALGDAAHAYAIGYDWLYPFMTQSQRIQIEELLDDLIEEIRVLSTTTSAGTLPAISSNHNSVSVGGMGLAALIRGSSQEILELAEERMLQYYNTSADSDGYSYEGISYYAYGLLGASIFNAALENLTGRDLLEQVPNYKKTSDMITYYTNTYGNDIIPIGDCDNSIAPAGGIMYLISKYQNQTALWNFLRLTGDEGNRSYGAGPDYTGASIPYIIVFFDTNLAPKYPFELPLGKAYESGFVSVRDSWDKDGSLLTFQSSIIPHRGHNQRDENSFTFDALGESFIIDPGYTPYESISHNVVMINGWGQSVPGDKYDVYGRLDEAIIRDGVAYLEGDATDTYSSLQYVSKVNRKILYRGGDFPYMVVVDDIESKTQTPALINVLFQTSNANRTEINSNADMATIIGGRSGNIMQISFPFDNSVILRNNFLSEKVVVGDRGDYKMSTYSKTLEALKTMQGSTRIVSLLLTAREGEELPKVSTTGTSSQGEIIINFHDGSIHRINISQDKIYEMGVRLELSTQGLNTQASVLFKQSAVVNEISGELYLVGYDGSVFKSLKSTPFEFNGYAKSVVLSLDGYHEKFKVLLWTGFDEMKPLYTPLQ